MEHQTAVEWFYYKISKIEVGFDDGNLIDKTFEQAKEMEKNQIEKLEDKISNLENMILELGEQQ